MLSHLLAASRHWEVGGGDMRGNGRDTTEAQSGREGWESPVPAKQED